MQHSEFVQKIVDQLTHVEGMKAIVLGGSWASGTQRPDSDIDLGLYYSDDSPLDVSHIRKIAIELNDVPNPVVTDLGGWGSWVNGGAWLTIKGQRVDFLYRNTDFVLDPQHPDHPGSAVGVDYAEWGSYIYIPTAGCYALEATWSGGHWRILFAAGHR